MGARAIIIELRVILICGNIPTLCQEQAAQMVGSLAPWCRFETTGGRLGCMRVMRFGVDSKETINRL